MERILPLVNLLVGESHETLVIGQMLVPCTTAKALPTSVYHPSTCRVQYRPLLVAVFLIRRQRQEGLGLVTILGRLVGHRIKHGAAQVNLARII